MPFGLSEKIMHCILEALDTPELKWHIDEKGVVLYAAHNNRGRHSCTTT